MAKNFKILQQRMSPEARAISEKRAAATLEKMALHDLRRVRRMNQTELAAQLGTAQSEVSKIENRADMHISTLRQYVEGLGGQLEMKAVFPEKTILLDLAAGRR
ncbi:MAG TPA: XRE family transcriptional regulator [Acidobacteriaceae bacterium]|nr:XRE family transcriptional regulator [Acidobacteriaceae bacterium]